MTLAASRSAARGEGKRGRHPPGEGKGALQSLPRTHRHWRRGRHHLHARPAAHSQSSNPHESPASRGERHHRRRQRRNHRRHSDRTRSELSACLHLRVQDSVSPPRLTCPPTTHLPGPAGSQGTLSPSSHSQHEDPPVRRPLPGGLSGYLDRRPR